MAIKNGWTNEGRANEVRGMATTFNIGEKVRACVTAQGMRAGTIYEITDIDTRPLGIFGTLVSYQLDGKLWISNGHLLLAREGGAR